MSDIFEYRISFLSEVSIQLIKLGNKQLTGDTQGR